MTNVSDLIRQEIGQKGPISFARFMELALYCPGSGFYEKETDTPGREGDFYTSVSVGPVFGQFLAFQFAGWLAEMPPAGPLQIVEAGAHDGRLAADILGWFRARRVDLVPRLQYWILEPSPRRQAWQQKRLEEFGNIVRWAANLADISGGVSGVIFSNELLDAMPLRRFAWDAQSRSWYERGVTVEGDRFTWSRLEDEVQVPELAGELLDVLPDGFTLETSPAAVQWWHDAADALRSGKLITFDYGFTEEEFLSPGRKDGTVRAYRRHKLMNDVLADPGGQDITAHVNFTAVQQAGEAAGLRTELFQTQTAFLTGITQRAWAEGSGFGEWTQNHTRQFQTLTHPDHLGRAFRVLVQAH